MRMDIQTVREDKGQGDEAEGGVEEEEEMPELAKDIRVVPERMQVCRATVTMGRTTDTIKGQCLGLAEIWAGY